MRKELLALCFAAGLLGGCVYPYYRRVPVYDGPEPYRAATFPVSIEDVIKLSKAGIGEEIILSKIRTDGVTAKPTADQVVSMKNEGVSERVIEAMVAAQVPQPVEPAPPRVVYRYEYAPWRYYDPWWYGWPYPYWHFNFHWRYRH